MKRNHTTLIRSKSDYKFIVVHYVGALGDAKANTDYYGSTDVGASADFWVGHFGDIWQGNDYKNYYSWHCGGGLQGSGGHKYYGQCTNRNSVGIEICVKKSSTKTMNATDKDWYFNSATIESAAELIASLMKELDINIDHVIRHYDVNGKICPNPFVYDNGNVSWAGFKKKVKAYHDKQNDSVAGGECEVKLKTFVRGDKHNQIKNIQRLLRQKGYKGKSGKLLNPDGRLGPNTAYALERYQRNAKLSGVTYGTIDQVTWTALLNSK